MQRGIQQCIKTMFEKQKTAEEIHELTDVPMDMIQEVKNSLKPL